MMTRLPVAQRRPKKTAPVFTRNVSEPELFIPPSDGMAAAVVPPPIFNPMYSVGHQLMKAREARSLSVEDVAFETRIPHQRLRDMENDDLSNFANLTYAKGFLKLYSRFLKLDLSDYLDEFDTSIIATVTGHEYVQTANAVRLLSAPMIAPDQGRSRPGLRGLAIFASIAAVVGWFFYKAWKPAIQDAPAPAQTALVKPEAPARPDPATTTPPALAKAESPTPSETRAAGRTHAADSPPPAEGVILKAKPVDDDGNEIPLSRTGQP